MERLPIYTFENPIICATTAIRDSLLTDKNNRVVGLSVSVAGTLYFLNADLSTWNAVSPQTWCAATQVQINVDANYNFNISIPQNRETQVSVVVTINDGTATNGLGVITTLEYRFRCRRFGTANVVFSSVEDTTAIKVLSAWTVSAAASGTNLVVTLTNGSTTDQMVQFNYERIELPILAAPSATTPFIPAGWNGANAAVFYGSSGLSFSGNGLISWTSVGGLFTIVPNTNKPQKDTTSFAGKTALSFTAGSSQSAECDALVSIFAQATAAFVMIAHVKGFVGADAGAAIIGAGQSSGTQVAYLTATTDTSAYYAHPDDNHAVNGGVVWDNTDHYIAVLCDGVHFWCYNGTTWGAQKTVSVGTTASVDSVSIGAVTLNGVLSYFSTMKLEKLLIRPYVSGDTTTTVAATIAAIIAAGV